MHAARRGAFGPRRVCVCIAEPDVDMTSGSLIAVSELAAAPQRQTDTFGGAANYETTRLRDYGGKGEGVLFSTGLRDYYGLKII